MLSAAEISERNALLINFITRLDVGIRIIDLPEKPKFVSHDYKYWLHAYVHNFNIKLLDAEFNGNVIAAMRVDSDPEEYRDTFLEWMVKYEHKRIYTITYKGLFLSGFNHHNKIDKSNPFPVFAKYYPHTYYSLAKAREIVDRFKEYELQIN